VPRLKSNRKRELATFQRLTEKGVGGVVSKRNSTAIDHFEVDSKLKERVWHRLLLLLAFLLTDYNSFFLSRQYSICKVVFFVTPAKAGVQKNSVHVFRLDSRFSGNDGVLGTLQGES